MSLRIAKRILLGACVVMAAALMLSGVTKALWLLYLGIVSAVIGGIIWAVFGRCPDCGGFLGRADSKYCPHCGAKIQW